MPWVWSSRFGDLCLVMGEAGGRNTCEIDESIGNFPIGKSLDVFRFESNSWWAWLLRLLMARFCFLVAPPFPADIGVFSCWRSHLSFHYDFNGWSWTTKCQSLGNSVWVLAMTTELLPTTMPWRLQTLCGHGQLSDIAKDQLWLPWQHWLSKARGLNKLFADGFRNLSRIVWM